VLLEMHLCLHFYQLAELSLGLTWKQKLAQQIHQNFLTVFFPFRTIQHEISMLFEEVAPNKNKYDEKFSYLNTLLKLRYGNKRIRQLQNQECFDKK
jgi:hypothetical protein